MSLIGQAILRESHILIDPVSTIIYTDSFDGTVKGSDVCKDTFDYRIEMRTGFKIIFLMTVEPGLVIVVLQLPEISKNVQPYVLFSSLCLQIILEEAALGSRCEIPIFDKGRRPAGIKTPYSE